MHFILSDSPLDELYEGASINHTQTLIKIQWTFSLVVM